MEKVETITNDRHFRTLDDIRQYKEQLHRDITKDEERIATKWNDLFHKNEDEPTNKAQRLTRMLSLGTGVFDGVMLGWKLYRKYQQGAFLFRKRKKK